jgi:hypothetical protein
LKNFLLKAVDETKVIGMQVYTECRQRETKTHKAKEDIKSVVRISKSKGFLEKYWPRFGINFAIEVIGDRDQNSIEKIEDCKGRSLDIGKILDLQGIISWSSQKVAKLSLFLSKVYQSFSPGCLSESSEFEVNGRIRPFRKGSEQRVASGAFQIFEIPGPAWIHRINNETR